MPNGIKLAWPWTVNYSGKGYFFPNKTKAKEFVKSKIDKGARNIDIGCMQVNLRYHPNAFPDLETAFDPLHNVKWAGTWLKELNKKYKSLKTATGYYHSSRRKNRTKYSTKVYKNWKEVNILNNSTRIAKALPLEEEKSNKNKINNTYRDNNITNNRTIKIEKEVQKSNLNKKVEGIHMANYIPEQINSLERENKQSTKIEIDSPYLIARMDKIKFFRNYFSKYR